MLQLKDLHKGYDFNSLDLNCQLNLRELFARMSKLEHLLGENFQVTSGLRTIDDQIRIYAERGDYDPPMGSKHLKGQAVDVLDNFDIIKKRLENNSQILIDCQLWTERGTQGWLHCQSAPPRSGSRFFYP